MSGAADTIFALASGPGRAGVAVIRVSGPRAHAALGALAGAVPSPRHASLRRLTARDGRAIDQGLVLAFAEGQSFTGESAAEFQVHGSSAVVRLLLSELAAMKGLRPAEAGEFTRRALQNGKLNLTQVEGLADLISAETETQLRQAQRLIDGALERRAASWRQRLLRATALLETTIDFVDEDVPVDVTPETSALLGGLLAEWKEEVAGVGSAERVRDGFEVALIGPPNAGKSTLVNAIARRDVAITSDVAGTTRDIIEVRLDLRGLPVTLLDTAGLNASAAGIEAIGVERSRHRAANADLRVFLSSTEEEIGALFRPGDLVVQGKADITSSTGLSVSGVTGAGVSELLDRIGATLEPRVAWSRTATNLRHASALRTAIGAAEAAQGRLGEPTSVDLAAADLRVAVHALDALVGRVDVEDVLGHIFASFCIGK